MVEESIVFSGEVSDRSLDQSAQKVEERFSEAGEIQVDAATDGLGMDGFGDGGDMGMGLGGGGGGGTGPLEVAGISSLASKIPKPMAGVAAGAILPVGLAGAAGAGMLSAMHSASARLQTSTSLLGQAWNNVWRPLGDSLDQLFVRDAVMDAVAATQEFEETWRSGAKFEAMTGLLNDISDTLPVSTTANVTLDLMDVVATGEVDLQSLKWRDFVNSLTWGEWVDDLLWTGFVTGVELGNFVMGTDMSAHVAATNLNDFVTGVDLGDMIEVPEWLSPGGGGADDHGFEGPTMPPSNPGGGGGGSTPWWLPGGPLLPPMQRGGRVERTGLARVHRGEMVADPDRLVNELAGAIRQAGGGGGAAEVDMGQVESKLDTLHRDLQRLGQAMQSMGIQVEGQQFGQVVANTQDGNVLDVDPTV